MPQAWRPWTRKKKSEGRCSFLWHAHWTIWSVQKPQSSKSRRTLADTVPLDYRFQQHLKCLIARPESRSFVLGLPPNRLQAPINSIREGDTASNECGQLGAPLPAMPAAPSSSASLAVRPQHPPHFPQVSQQGRPRFRGYLHRPYRARCGRHAGRPASA